MQVAEWKLLQRLPTLSLSQLNPHLEALIQNKQGSAALYQKLAERCVELTASAAETDLETSIKLLTCVKAGDTIGQFYAKALPRVSEMIKTLPGERAASVVVAYAAAGVVSPALYQQANTVLKPVAAQLQPALAVKLANWLAPYLQPLPENSTFYPELEQVPLQSCSQAVSLLQGFVKARKGSYSFLNRISAFILSDTSALPDHLQSAAIHYLCKSGLQDADTFAELERRAIGLDVRRGVGSAFDLASAGYRPDLLLSALRGKAQDFQDVRDLICLEWVYRLGGQPLPNELETVKSFLLLHGLHVSPYLLARRLSTLN